MEVDTPGLSAASLPSHKHPTVAALLPPPPRSHKNQPTVNLQLSPPPAAVCKCCNSAPAPPVCTPATRVPPHRFFLSVGFVSNCSQRGLAILHPRVGCPPSRPLAARSPLSLLYYKFRNLFGLQAEMVSYCESSKFGVPVY